MNITKKITGALTGALVAAMIFGFVALPTAQALTQAEANGIIAALGLSGSQAAAIQALVTAGSQAPAATCDTYGTTSIVRVGNTGEKVKAIQRAMNQILDLSNGTMTPLVVDGAFGPLTKGVVQYFQGVIGTTPDGIWGPNTQGSYVTYVANNCTSAPVTPVVNGWSVSAAAGSTATTLVSGQASAELLNLQFTGNGTVNSVKLQRTGVSSNNVLSNVYLFDGAVRLTDAASVLSTGEIMFNMPSGIFTVNGSKTISVRADISTSNYAGQTVGVNFVNAMSGSATISGSATGMVRTLSYVSDLAAVSFSTVSPTNATLQPAAGVTVWQSTATITNHDVMLDRVAFRQIGSAPASAFGTFKLYVNGIEVAQASGLDSNGYVTFVPAMPVLMQAGSRTMRVDADIVGGSSRTVHFSLRNAADASFRDVQYGVNGSISGSNISAVAANTISGSTGGSMTVIKDTTSPSLNIGIGASDVSLGKFKLTAYGEAIKVETLTAGFSSSDGSIGSLRNGKILIDGVPYGSQSTIVAAGTSFTVNKIINAGQSAIVEVRADVFDNDGTNNVTAADTITATLVQGSSNAQKVESLGVLNVPAATTSANALTVASATATLAKTATYADQTVALPHGEYKLASWSLTGSSIESILVTGFTVTDTGSTDTFEVGDVTNLTLRVNGSNVQAPIAQATASNSFATQFTVGQNGSALVELYGDLSNASATATDDVRFALAMEGISQPSGTSVSVTATNGQSIAAGAGTITATASGSTPVAGILKDNQTATVAAFKFDAVNSSYNVSDMTFTIANATNVASIDLYDGATLVASKPGAATVSFNGLSNFAVSANTSKTLTVKLALATAGYQAGTSGASVLVTLTEFTAVSSTGVSDVSANDAGPSIENNPAGNAMYVYAGIPAMEKLTSSATILLAGERDLIKFRISADGGNIAWNELLLDVTKADGPVITLASLALYEVTGGASNQLTATETGSTELDDTAAGSGTVTIVPGVEQEIAAGSYRDYVLRGTITGTIGAGDYITTKFSSDTLGYAASAAYSTVTAAGVAPIIWSDMSAQSHSTSTTDWSNGYGVKTLPISETLVSIE